MFKLISYPVRVFVDRRSMVLIGVRWSRNGVSQEVTFTTGCRALKDEAHWDSELQKAKKNTSHTIDVITLYARQINTRIAMFVDVIDEVTTRFNLQQVLPTPKQLRDAVEGKMKKMEQTWMDLAPQTSSVNTIAKIMELFLAEKREDASCGEVTITKHRQVLKHVQKYRLNAEIEDVDREWLNGFRDWYVQNNYQNRTTKKMIVFIKELLCWAATKGYNVSKEATNYKFRQRYRT